MFVFGSSNGENACFFPLSLSFPATVGINSPNKAWLYLQVPSISCSYSFIHDKTSQQMSNEYHLTGFACFPTWAYLTSTCMTIHIRSSLWSCNVVFSSELHWLVHTWRQPRQTPARVHKTIVMWAVLMSLHVRPYVRSHRIRSSIRLEECIVMTLTVSRCFASFCIGMAAASSASQKVTAESSISCGHLTTFSLFTSLVRETTALFTSDSFSIWMMEHGSDAVEMFDDQFVSPSTRRLCFQKLVLCYEM